MRKERRLCSQSSGFFCFLNSLTVQPMLGSDFPSPCLSFPGAGIAGKYLHALRARQSSMQKMSHHFRNARNTDFKIKTRNGDFKKKKQGGGTRKLPVGIHLEVVRNAEVQVAIIIGTSILPFIYTRDQLLTMGVRGAVTELRFPLTLQTVYRQRTRRAGLKDAFQNRACEKRCWRLRLGSDIKCAGL